MSRVTPSLEVYCLTGKLCYVLIMNDDNKPTLHQIFKISVHGKLVQTVYVLSHLKCP